MNVGWVDVTFASGVATGNWRHPDQTKRGSNADTIELDDTPAKIEATPTLHSMTNIGIPHWVATANSIRGVSSHNSDTSTWRVWAWVKVPSPLSQGQR